MKFLSTIIRDHFIFFLIFIFFCFSLLVHSEAIGQQITKSKVHQGAKTQPKTGSTKPGPVQQKTSSTKPIPVKQKTGATTKATNKNATSNDMKISKDIDYLKKNQEFLEKKTDHALNQYQNIFILFITIIGTITTIINIVLTVVISHFYVQSSKLIKENEKLNKDIKKDKDEYFELNKEQKMLEKRHFIVQNELSRVIWFRYEKLMTDTMKDSPDKSTKIAKKMVEDIYHIDRYRWAIINCLSPYRHLRIKAIHDLATKQVEFPIAKEFLVQLLDVFHDNKFKPEVKTIHTALNL